MDVQKLGRSNLINFMARFMGPAMDNRVRAFLLDPERTLDGTGIEPGQRVLEIGSGPGFFTVRIAKRLGDNGELVVIEPLAKFVQTLREKVRLNGLNQVRILQTDAIDSRLPDASIDLVLLLGVVPYPTLPLAMLLPELHRVLACNGKLAVWLFPATAGVPTAISRSGLFEATGKVKGVFRYVKK